MVGPPPTVLEVRPITTKKKKKKKYNCHYFKDIKQTSWVGHFYCPHIGQTTRTVQDTTVLSIMWQNLFGIQEMEMETETVAQ